MVLGDTQREGGTMPKVLQLYKQEKFLEKWLKIPIPDFHLQSMILRRGDKNVSI